MESQNRDPDAQLDQVEAEEHLLRPFGLCKGAFEVPDDFDAALPEEILLAFEGR